jgi:hypothetical protein
MIYSLQLRIRKGDSPRNSLNPGEMGMMNGVPVMMMPPSVAYDGTSVPMIAPDGSLMISHIPTQPDQSNMIMDPNASYAPDPFLNHPVNPAAELKNIITSSLNSLSSNGEKSPANRKGSKSPTRKNSSGSSTPRATSPKKASGKSTPTASSSSAAGNSLKKTGSSNNLHVTVSFDQPQAGAQASKPAATPQQPQVSMGYAAPPTPSNGMKYPHQVRIIYICFRVCFKVVLMCMVREYQRICICIHQMLLLQ